MTGLSEGVPARFFALVPCAGAGARAGTPGPKQYMPIAGRAMVAHTLAALMRVQRLTSILVALAPDDALFERRVPEFAGERYWVARCGGATRAETVANALAQLVTRGVQPHDWVLVHDAARCLIRPDWVDRLIDACQRDVVGGLLALPVSDTLKQGHDTRIVATVDRIDKWAAQTPQMFRLGLLQDALARSTGAVTDEASAIEAMGHQPKLVEGALENFKLTWWADFDMAERLLRHH